MMFFPLMSTVIDTPGGKRCRSERNWIVNGLS